MIGLQVERHDQVPVARLSTDVDAANASQLREELWAHLGAHGGELVIDLSSTRYLDSAGIDTLFRLAHSLSERRGTLRLVIPADSPLARLAQIVALPNAVPVHATVEEAIEAFGTGPGLGDPAP
jgi:anti-sigma B factor antagonist